MNMLHTIKKPITLIGMMGCGKSHIGRLLGQALNVDFVDSDTVIEEKAGCCITEIFARDGEPVFRRAEHNTIIELLKNGPQVIATGGGATTHPYTLSALLSESICIYLKADLETLWDRVKNNTARPLLQNDNPKQILSDLLTARQDLYEQAHITVKVDHLSPKHVVERIIKDLT